MASTAEEAIPACAKQAITVYGGTILSDPSLANVGQCTRHVVDFVHDLSFNDLPQEVVDHTKLVLLDTIGALIAASTPGMMPVEH